MLEHVRLQRWTSDVLPGVGGVQAIQGRAVRKNNVVIPEIKRARVCERVDGGEGPLLRQEGFVEGAGQRNTMHADGVTSMLHGDALIADVLRERLEELIRQVDVMVALHPEDLRAELVQPFKQARAISSSYSARS